MTDAYAYAVTGNDLFGVLDLNTGVFTELGDMGQRIEALGVGPNGVLYGAAYSSDGYAAYHSPTLYSINPAAAASRWNILTVSSDSSARSFPSIGSFFNSSGVTVMM